MFPGQHQLAVKTIKFTANSKKIVYKIYELESGTKLSQIEYESGTFEAAKVCGNFVSEKM